MTREDVVQRPLGSGVAAVECVDEPQLGVEFAPAASYLKYPMPGDFDVVPEAR